MTGPVAAQFFLWPVYWWSVLWLSLMRSHCTGRVPSAGVMLSRQATAPHSSCSLDSVQHTPGCRAWQSIRQCLVVHSLLPARARTSIVIADTSLQSSDPPKMYGSA